MELKGKNVLVTGGTGFLGRHVVDVLQDRGANPIVYSSDEYNLLIKSDVVHMLHNTPSPDAVIHLAAVVGGIGANRAKPATFLHDNLLMGLNLISIARRPSNFMHNISKFVMVGTVCSYPKFTPVPFKESDLWNGYPEDTNAPYGIAKKTLGVLIQAARQQDGFNGVYVIPVNLYGPGDNIDLATSHVIPAMMRKMLEAKRDKAKSVMLWGTGTPTREFLYVKDAAEGIVRGLEKLETSDPVNLGSGQEISMHELALEIKEVVGYDGELIWNSNQPDGQPRRCLDTSKAEKLLGWKSTTPLAYGLIDTLNDIRQRLGIREESTSD